MVKNIPQNSIDFVVDKKLCTGCGTCQALCPNDAIQMQIDHREGVYFPNINSTKCNRCGYCIEICPGHAVDFIGLNRHIFGKIPEDLRIGNFKEAYLSFSNDSNIRFNGASGGMVTALLLYALNKGVIDGALVTDMRTDIPWQPRPVIARNQTEILSAARSKYCPVPANIALSEIIQTPGRYAVVGLPCHIQAIRKAQLKNKSLRKRIKFVFGLFCASGRSFKGLEALLSKLNRNIDEVDSIRYRGEGWPGLLRIKFKNGEIYSAPLEKYYPYMCCNDPYRCSLCPDKTNELSDISFGDAWADHIPGKNQLGNSICISRTDESKAFLEEAIKEGAITAMPVKDRIIESIQPYNKKKSIVARRTLCKFVGKSIPDTNCDLLPMDFMDFIDAVKHYGVTWLCQYKIIQKIYFFSRHKYRNLEYEVISDKQAMHQL